MTSIDIKDNAAHNLLGTTLTTGWTITEKYDKTASTGAFFSVCYKVTKEGQECFLKAFDFGSFFLIADAGRTGRSVTDVLAQMLEAFRYERDLSNHCRDHSVTRVSFVKEAGEETVPGFVYNIVPYLIFDMADGDVRNQLSVSDRYDFAWKLKSLHDVAVGLKQLHLIGVSHQDLKPSNVLVFNKRSKIGDLGRSLCKVMDDGPFKGKAYTGDNTYAPPEIMYKYYVSNWEDRVFATDCYLLGSLILFYVCGVSMSALLIHNLPSVFKPLTFSGTLESLKVALEKCIRKIFVPSPPNDRRGIYER